MHRGDLVISTMGRAFWIMDDVAPLRQLAAGSMTDAAARRLRRCCSRAIAESATALAAAAAAAADRSTRRRALAIDYVLPDGFTGPLSLEITRRRAASSAP